MLAGELEQQPRVDGPEPARSVSTPPREEPLHLGAREVGIEHQPAPLRTSGSWPRLPQLLTTLRRAAGLLYERAVDRLARLPVPGDDRLAPVW